MRPCPIPITRLRVSSFTRARLIRSYSLFWGVLGLSSSLLLFLTAVSFFDKLELDQGCTLLPIRSSVNPLISISDQDRISPYNINTISTR